MDVIYTHYDYLEVPPGAPRERIEAAYARVLERFNDGMAPSGQDLSGLVRMIHSAYRVLSDPDSRRAYDAQLARDAHQADAELKADLDARARLPRRVQDVPEPLNAAFAALAA
jgi:DnaJ-class molecular chaperone